MRHFSTLSEALAIAEERGIALGAFEFWSFDVARAIVSAAQAADAPVIMQCGKMEIDRMGGEEATVQIAHQASRDTTVPVVLHLDHATEYDACNRAILAGFSSVMIDASALPYEENAALTKRVAQRAHAVGLSVEGELGRLVGEEGDLVVTDAEAAQTDPDQAREFVAFTGIDALAVSIGTAHGQYTFTPKLNLARLERIKQTVSVPLVLHGGSGTPDDQVQTSIGIGIRKINVCTDIQVAMGQAYTQIQASAGFKYSCENLWGAGEKAAYETILSKIRLFKRGRP